MEDGEDEATLFTGTALIFFGVSYFTMQATHAAIPNQDKLGELPAFALAIAAGIAHGTYWAKAAYKYDAARHRKRVQ